MSTLCCKCKKRPAMVFLQKFDPTGKEPTQSEGYCLICAKQLGIGPVSDMLEKMGIDDDQLENMSDELSGLMENGGFFPGMPMDAVNPDDPENPDGDSGDNDTDSTVDPDESETGTPSVNLGSLYGNLGTFGAIRQNTAKDSKKKPSNGR